jgi:non-ribosomal peptide synthetase component F
MSMPVAEMDRTVSRIADALPGPPVTPTARSGAGTGHPPVVHRIVERHAALRTDAPAIRDGGRVVSWRELNHRANALARALMAAGFRRGDVAHITVPLGADLAIVLLAVLKVGGSYTWTRPTAEARRGVLITRRDGTTTMLAVDHVLSGPCRPCPNLPVMVRGSDPACLLQEGTGTIVIPHASVAALQETPVPPGASWSGAPGAIDLWIILMTGLTAIVTVDCNRAACRGDHAGTVETAA